MDDYLEQYHPELPMEEEWKQIKCFPNYYVSNYGRIYNSCRMKYKVPQLNGCGYLRIELWKNNKRTRFLIHRLVAQYFLDDFDPEKDVDHINGKRTDNAVVNLRCVTRSENVLAAYERARQTPEEEMEMAMFLNQWWSDDDE